jgi:uncharacterized membrane protein
LFHGLDLMNLQRKFRFTTTRTVALVIVALGFALRLYTLAGESLWYDELLQLDIAQDRLVNIFPRLRGHSAVPLDYLIVHFWIWLGRGEGWVRLPAVFGGTLTLPVAYRLGQAFLGRKAGLLFMFLLALSPVHVQYSQEVRPYALVVLGITLTVYAFWRLNQTDRWRYAVPLQIGVLIFSLAHIFAIVIFLPLAIFAGLDSIFRQKRRGAHQSFVILILSGVAPLLIFILMGWGDVLFYASRGFGQALVEPDAFVVGADQELAREGGPELDGPFFRDKIFALFAPSPSIMSLWLFNGLAGLGLIYFLTQKRVKPGLLLALWVVLVPLIIVSFLVFREKFFAPRYIISILPAYLILVTAGILALPQWLKQIGLPWLSAVMFLILASLVLVNLTGGLGRYYREPDKENWRLVSNFIAANAGSDDVVIAFKAESAMNWYYPQIWVGPNYYENLEVIKATTVQARRSWVILSIFSADTDAKVKAWLSEQQAIRFVLDPVIHVYYLGHNVSADQLLAEIQGFGLPVDHALYASLARENRRRLEVARQYYQLAIEHAPDAATRAEYQAALGALAR